MGYPIFGIYRDKESGGTSNRPAFKKLFEDAAMHKFDLVLFWAMVENPLKLTT
jgi:DNA invertase Pin-like site-specific DNA recombinase